MWFVAAVVLTIFSLILTIGGWFTHEPRALAAGIVLAVLVLVTGMLAWKELRLARQQA